MTNKEIIYDIDAMFGGKTIIKNIKPKMKYGTNELEGYVYDVEFSERDNRRDQFTILGDRLIDEGAVKRGAAVTIIEPKVIAYVAGDRVAFALRAASIQLAGKGE